MASEAASQIDSEVYRSSFQPGGFAVEVDRMELQAEEEMRKIEEAIGLKLDLVSYEDDSGSCLVIRCTSYTPL